MEINLGFSVGSTPKKVIGFKERENGDLVVVLNRAKFYREHNKPLAPDAAKIIHQKYSVHRSLKSTQDINTFTHILELSDGKKIETAHYTQAIKKFKRLAPIFASLSPSLASQEYTFSGDEENFIVLGDHNPENSLLFYMVCVSAKEVPLNFSALRESYVFSFKKFSFTYFDIYVLWSFALGISGDEGAKVHFTTHRDRKEVAEQARYRWLVEGLDPVGICEMFKVSRHRLHLEAMHLLLLDASAQERALIESVPFFLRCGRCAW